MAAYEQDVDDLLTRESKITSVRIAQLLREKYPSFVLGERAARVYVSRRRTLLHPKEVFIRQVYVAGDQVQYDFKDIRAVIDGSDVDLHMFTARLSYSLGGQSKPTGQGQLKIGQWSDRGRDEHCCLPPARIPASAINAPGSYLE